MFGCIGRIVVLAVLVVLGATAYATRGLWEPKLRARVGARPAGAPTVPTWEPITAEGAGRVRAQLESFRRPAGPVFANVGAGDLVAFAAAPMLRKFSAVPPLPGTRGGSRSPAEGAEALAGENTISVRGNVKMSDLGGVSALGPLTGVLEGTQRIEVRGRMEVTAVGKAVLRVERIVIGELPLPGAVIGRVIQRMMPRADTTLPAEAIALRIPAEVADIRLAPGRVTLYKAVK